MKRFRWNTKQGDYPFIWATIAWMKNRQINDIDEAMKRTLPKHSTNPEAIPQMLLKSLRKQVQIELKGKRQNDATNQNRNHRVPS